MTTYRGHSVSQKNISISCFGGIGLADRILRTELGGGSGDEESLFSILTFT